MRYRIHPPWKRRGSEGLGLRRTDLGAGSFHSHHKLSTKLAIFKGEATRHLLNCNRIEDFQREISELRMNLARRGYPQHAMPNVEYDPVKRQGLLQKLHAREQNCSKKRNDAVMVFKCPYTPVSVTQRSKRSLLTTTARVGLSAWASHTDN